MAANRDRYASLRVDRETARRVVEAKDKHGVTVRGLLVALLNALDDGLEVDWDEVRKAYPTGGDRRRLRWEELLVCMRLALSSTRRLMGEDELVPRMEVYGYSQGQTRAGLKDLIRRGEVRVGSTGKISVLPSARPSA